MSRCDQFIGLSPSTKKSLNKIGCICIPDKSIYSYEDMNSWERWLAFFWLKDGRKLYEKVQCEIWSSGSMYFTKLVDKDGEDVYTWSDEEIKEYFS